MVLRGIGSHVFLVRHGRTQLNASGVLRGRLDPPLDEVGHVEAYELAVALAYARPTRIVSSPLRRAVQTAEPLAQRAHVDIAVDDRLADRDYGSMAGQAISDARMIDEAVDVEPVSAVYERARKVLDEQTGHVTSGPVVLVAHEAVNRLLLARIAPELGPANGIPQHTGCWNVLVLDGGVWRVEQVDQRP